MKPLAIDLYCGLGGWAEGLLAEGFDVIGFDIERHVYGAHRYPAQLVVQDVLTLHGSQLRDAALIVCSPPCQFFSYCAMPWTKAKQLAAAVRADPVRLESELALFNACFRIQREACASAGRHIPLIVENVRGAQPWVGRARWMYGSFALWGDVPALMPPIPAQARLKNAGPRWDPVTGSGAHGMTRWTNPSEGTKNAGGSWFAVAHNTASGKGRNPDGRKVPGGGAEGWFGYNDHPLRRHHSKHAKRKFASAMLAKIPLPLARHIARTFRPGEMAA